MSAKRGSFAVKRPALNTSTFNIREIAKQMLLLEEHLTDKEKFCVDCIRKHLLTVEALAEEAMAMDPAGRYVDECRNISGVARGWAVMFQDGVDPVVISKDVRKYRKRIVEMCFDPRG